MSLALATRPMSRVLIVREPAAVSTLEHDWQQLFEACGAKNPFLSWAWQQAWVETHPQVRPWVVAERFADGSLAGLVAFELVQRGPFYSLEALAQEAGGDEIDLLVHPEADADLPSRLLDIFLHTRGWHVWRLDSVLADGILPGALEPLTMQHRLKGVYELTEYLPLLRLPRTFEQFLATKSSGFRSDHRRRARTLERRAGRVRLHVAQSTEEVLSALQVLFDLHNRRRAQKKGIGIFEDAAMCEFHRLVARRLAPKKRARVYLLIAGERPIAALYGFESGKTFQFFQSGLDPDWSETSPGKVLLDGVIDECIQRGVERFDFLRGDEPYKARWANEGRYTAHVRLGRGGFGDFYFQVRARLKGARDRVLAVGRG